MSKTFEQKPGTGTLFEPRQKNDRGPDFKGFLQLPSGEIVGVACWRKQTRNGELLSLSVDQREGEYQAKRMGLPLYGGGESRSDARGGQRDDAAERFARGGARGDDRRDKWSDRERAGFGRGDQRRDEQDRRRDDRGFSDDMDDEIPF